MFDVQYNYLKMAPPGFNKRKIREGKRAGGTWHNEVHKLFQRMNGLFRTAY